MKEKLKMKRVNKILPILLFVLCAFVMVGCKGGGEENNPGEIIDDDDRPIITPNDETVHISYWHANGAALTTVLESIKADFEAKYKGKYIVDLTSYGDYTTLRDTISSSIAAGDAPTAAQTYPDHVSLYLEGEALASLNRYMKHPTYGMTADEQA